MYCSTVCRMLADESVCATLGASCGILAAYCQDRNCLNNRYSARDLTGTQLPRASVVAISIFPGRQFLLPAST